MSMKKPKPKKTPKPEKVNEVLTEQSVTYGVECVDGVEYFFIGEVIEGQTEIHEIGILLENLVEYLSEYARVKRRELSKQEKSAQRELGLV